MNCSITDIFPFDVFMNYSASYMCLYKIMIYYLELILYHNQLISHYHFVKSKYKWVGAYTMIEHVGLNVVPWLNMSVISFLLQNLHAMCLTHKFI